MSSLSTNDLQRIFERLDKNQDGYVSSIELSQILQVGIEISFTHNDLESLMRKTSLDFIDFVLFYETLVNKVDNQNATTGMDSNIIDESEEKDLVKAFRVFDVNGDGVITSEELGNVLSRLGMWNEHCGEGDCDSMIRTYDANLDGVLDFEEFKNMLVANNS
ncbi:probable calcium-binding protein CML44 [Impatiens glandulifera]|uniref:probable calcium-binding protein CML44 n=1 Tax=Impatiens glandulifera TaxID=253017 RepID=UPI001FB11CD6|nr:probable calcium-binding protein CML44 [Impatiens glandulifera]